jgi:NADH-quinone oxidoreductase subunit A
MIEEYIPILIVLAVALIFGSVLVLTSTIIGPQRPNREKTSTYESGMQPVGTTRQRIWK